MRKFVFGLLFMAVFQIFALCLFMPKTIQNNAIVWMASSEDTMNVMNPQTLDVVCLGRVACVSRKNFMDTECTVDVICKGEE